MKINQIMTPSIHTIEAKTNLVQASRYMRDEDVGFLPVVSEQGLAGTLTDRDIVVRAIAAEKDPKTTPVSEIMTGDPAYCHADDDTAKAAGVMEQRQVRRLLVLDPRDQPVGVVSLGDISGADPSLSGEALQTITEQPQQEDEEMMEKIESVMEGRINPLS